MVYGDSAYGTGAHLAWLGEHGLAPMVTTQVPTAPGGRFAKDQFRIDLARRYLRRPRDGGATLTAFGVGAAFAVRRSAFVPNPAS